MIKRKEQKIVNGNKQPREYDILIQDTQTGILQGKYEGNLRKLTADFKDVIMDGMSRFPGQISNKFKTIRNLVKALNKMARLDKENLRFIISQNG